MSSTRDRNHPIPCVNPTLHRVTQCRLCNVQFPKTCLKCLALAANATLTNHPNVLPGPAPMSTPPSVILIPVVPRETISREAAPQFHAALEFTALEEVLTGLSFGGSFGLLIKPVEESLGGKILIADHWTREVIEEAVTREASCIVTMDSNFHVRAITNNSWQEHAIDLCRKNKISVISPFITWNVIKLSIDEMFKEVLEISEVKESVAKDQNDQDDIIITIGTNVENVTFPSLRKLSVDKVKVNNTTEFEYRYTFISSSENSTNTWMMINQINLSYLFMNSTKNVNSAMGSKYSLKNPISISDFIDRVKVIFKVPTVKYALAVGSNAGRAINNFAFCQHFDECPQHECDMILVPENSISSYDVLNLTQSGATVIMVNIDSAKKRHREKFFEKFSSSSNIPTIELISSKTPIKLFKQFF